MLGEFWVSFFRGVEIRRQIESKFLTQKCLELCQRNVCHQQKQAFEGLIFKILRKKNQQNPKIARHFKIIKSFAFKGFGIQWV